MDCGYSEDDVMKMISMCKDIAESEEQQEKEQTAPVRENWELEGIIPYEDFMKMNFISAESFDDFKNYDIISLWGETCDLLDIAPIFIKIALRHANTLREKSLSEITNNNYRIIRDTVTGFKDISKWAAIYGSVYSKIILGNDEPIMISDEAMEKIIELIEEERKSGDFHPVDMMVLKINGWNGTETLAKNTDTDDLKNKRVGWH